MSELTEDFQAITEIDLENLTDITKPDQIDMYLLLEKIRTQFEESENCIDREDYLKFLLVNIFSLSEDFDSDLHNLETELESDEITETFLLIKSNLIELFSLFYGIEMELDNVTMENIYELYETFVLNPNQIAADMLIGIINPNSDIIPENEKTLYTLGFGFSKIRIEQGVEENLITNQTEENFRDQVSKLLVDRKKLSKEEIENVQEWVKTSTAFLSLFYRTFFEFDEFTIETDNLFDNILDLCIFGNETENYNNIRTMILIYKISYTTDILYKKLMTIFTSEDNLDDIEDKYRKGV